MTVSKKLISEVNYSGAMLLNKLAPEINQYY